jgi:CBS domain-containing protein
MHASDVVESIPSARLDDAVLPAVRMVLRHDLPGLIVIDEQGRAVAGISSVDLLRATLPRYVRNEPCIARLYGEEHGDLIAAQLAGASVRDVIGDIAGRIPVARRQATLVEVAEMMARLCCPVVLVERDADSMLGMVTANGLLKVLLAAVEDSPQ